MNSDLSRRVFLGLGGGAAVSAALAACSSPQGGGGASSGGKLTGPITFWSGYSTTDPNDKSKKPQDFWITQSAERFTKKTGVKVQMAQLPGDATQFTKIRTAAIGGNGPDVASVWSGSYMLSLKSFLEPMAKYFPESAMKGISGWPAVSDGADPTKRDTILGVPNGTDGATTLIFNKATLEKAGVDPSGWPVSYDEWVKQLDKLKKSGITPLSLSKLSIPFFLFDTWLAQAVGGPAGIADLSTGARKFNSPEVLDLTQKMVALRQYTLPGAASTEDPQAIQQVYAGKAAMTVVPGAGVAFQMRKQFKDNAAMAKLPDITPNGVKGGTVGGAGVAFIVLKGSKHKESAVAFIKHLLSPEEQRKYASSKDPGPLVGRTDLGKLYSDPLVNQVQEWGTEPSNTFWPDNTFSADLVSELGAQIQLLWNGSISPTQFLSRLDTKRDSLKK